MGLGFVSYDDCCDFDDGYGDGPCGGYYSYWDNCRRPGEHCRDKGRCDDECGRDKGCGRERGHENCRDGFKREHAEGCCKNECGRGRGCRNECGHDNFFGCRNECGHDRGCRCKPNFPGFGFPPFFECGPGWHNTPCGMFFNVPLGGCNLGLFMPYK